MTLKTQSTASLLADRLRAMINNGTLPTGTRLVERDLASQFSVSRVPMREAIRLLEQEGLVDLYLNRGAVVRTLSADDIRHIYHLRALLEGDAILYSVPDLDAESLARAELVHHLLGGANDTEKQGALNLEFHNILYAACGNPRQLLLIAELRNQIERYEHLQRKLLADTPMFQDEHAAILDACRDGDAEKAREMTIEHILSAGKIVLDAVAHSAERKSSS
ncbi:GntR family transcriptional regulator [Erwinia sp. S38]|uniref:GntR family transcriptional regulator n=1 Tax=Erwinia sp. S38 TaxID=2769338 RepID=UPI00190DEDD5|nr:GntR family transcriptional regulator [Erwinia sp. S38]MBK0000746.1 GntR family transcriptional regulator [Erwinia sp. S38]